MDSRYAEIVRTNLTAAFERGEEVLCRSAGAQSAPACLEMPAFGEACRITEEAIEIGERAAWGPRGVVLSLYLRYAAEDPLVETPFRAYREWPDSGPYAAAFKRNAEEILVPWVDAIASDAALVLERFAGRVPEAMPGDFALLLAPLPKIRLCYVFYHSDEMFPASVSCLFSRNADRFLPLDGLADLAEYTSRSLLRLLEAGR